MIRACEELNPYLNCQYTNQAHVFLGIVGKTKQNQHELLHHFISVLTYYITHPTSPAPQLLHKICIRLMHVVSIYIVNFYFMVAGLSDKVLRCYS